MASPAEQAGAIARILAGESTAAAEAGALGVNRSTVGRWVQTELDKRAAGDPPAPPGGTIVSSSPSPPPRPPKPSEEKARTFDELLIGFLTKSLVMMESVAELASDHDFHRSNPRDALELVRFTSERADGVMAVVQRLRGDPRPDA